MALIVLVAAAHAACTGEDAVLTGSGAGTPDGAGGGESGGPDGANPDGGGGGDADAGPPKPGDIDPAFANGILRGPSGQPFPMEVVHAIAVDGKGRTYVAGGADRCVIATPTPGSFRDFAIVRLDATGQVDTAFGKSGRGCADIKSRFKDEITAITIAPGTGHILVAGTSADPFENDPDLNGPRAALARFLDTGDVDTTFSGGAPYRVDSAKNVLAYPTGVTVDTAGTTYVGGIGDPVFGLDEQGAWVMRFRPDGTIDTGFNNTGFVSNNMSGVYGVAGDGTSGVFLVGGGKAFRTDRYTLGGAEIPPWGTGPGTADPGGESQARGAVATTDRLFVATIVNRPAGAAIAPSGVVKHLYDASLDKTFAAGAAKPGIFVTDRILWDRNNQFSGIALQADGKILLGGLFDGASATGFDLAVLRLNANGTVDESFGEKGIARTRAPGAEKMVGMAIDAFAGRVVLLGLDGSNIPIVYRFVL